MNIYFDNSATTVPVEKAFDAFLKCSYANPSSLHTLGFNAELEFLDSVKTIAKAIGCNSEEIVITSGATESNNLAIIGAARALKRKGNRIVTTKIEHPSVLEALKYLEKEGFEIVYVSPNENNEYTKECFLPHINENTILVSCMAVNNETGLLLPIEEIASGVKKVNPNLYFHTDNVQGFLRYNIKLKNIDLLSVSAHKIGGFKGVGALYIKKGVRLIPLLYGGGQQKNIRPGTHNLPLTVAFAAAINQNLQSLQHYKALKEYLLSKLPNCVTVNSKEDAAPYIVNISVKNIRSEIMLHFLSSKGVYVSSGSACAKGVSSYVLSALNVNNADSALRISFGYQNTKEEIDYFINALEEGISSIKTN